MADTKELKPKSFRIDDETAQKFKDISESLGKASQQETMNLLLNAYCMQEHKAALTDYKAELERIEGYTTAILQMYTGALQANKDMSATIRADYDALLTSKDKTIQNLQEQMSVAKQTKEDAVNHAKALTDTNVSLNDEIDRLKASLSDKDNLNRALTSSCNDLKSKIEEMHNQVEQATGIKSEMEQLQRKCDTLEATSNALRADLSDLDAKHEEILRQQAEQAQIALEKALLEQEKKYQAELEALKSKKNAEIDVLRDKYAELLQKMEIGRNQ